MNSVEVFKSAMVTHMEVDPSHLPKKNQTLVMKLKTNIDDMNEMYSEKMLTNSAAKQYYVSVSTMALLSSNFSSIASLDEDGKYMDHTYLFLSFHMDTSF